jgi:hypothetical protein
MSDIEYEKEPFTKFDEDGVLREYSYVLHGAKDKLPTRTIEISDDEYKLTFKRVEEVEGVVRAGELRVDTV